MRATNNGSSTMIKYLTFIISAALLLTACNHRDCSQEYRPGPAVVTIECVEDALSDALDEAPLQVEYSYDGDEWIACERYYLESDDDIPTQNVCDANTPFSPKFECGGRWRPRQAGSFFIRATQGERSAGPVRIKTRMANYCDFDEDTLYHELHLDLND